MFQIVQCILNGGDLDEYGVEAVAKIWDLFDECIPGIWGSKEVVLRQFNGWKRFVEYHINNKNGYIHGIQNAKPSEFRKRIIAFRANTLTSVKCISQFGQYQLCYRCGLGCGNTETLVENVGSYEKEVTDPKKMNMDTELAGNKTILITHYRGDALKAKQFTDKGTGIYRKEIGDVVYKTNRAKKHKKVVKRLQRKRKTGCFDLPFLYESEDEQ